MCRTGRTAALRLTAAIAVGLAVLAGIGLLAYQLASARVPQYRATLERLVRARTGLDAHFNELGLRWGWYGPEAVFHAVELSEPEHPGALLRASELIVGLDAWRTLERGTLEAGRITLVAPTLDLTGRPSAHAQSKKPVSAEDTAWLTRWPSGRVDIEDGTLILSDPTDPAHGLVLGIRHAVLRHADGEWGAGAQIWLPEHLGQLARLTLRLRGEAAKPLGLEGHLRLEGRGLQVKAWRALAWPRFALAQYLPCAGSGSVSVDLTWARGRWLGASGELKLGGLAFTRSVSSAVSPAGFLQGAWHLAPGRTGWHLATDRLLAGLSAKALHPVSVELDLAQDGTGAHGRVMGAPVEWLVAATPWLAPELGWPPAVRATGSTPDVTFTWDPTQMRGAQLGFQAVIAPLELDWPERGLSLRGLEADLTGTETRIDARLHASAASFERGAPGEASRLDELRIASRWRLERSDRGWALATDRAELALGAGRLTLSGSLQLGSRTALVAVHAVASELEVRALRLIIGDEAQSLWGARGLSLDAGRIVHGELAWLGAADAPPSEARVFSGLMLLRRGQLRAADPWPDLQDVEGRLEWRGSTLRAVLDRASAGPFALSALTAQWRAPERDAERTPGSAWRLTGEAQARMEVLLPWLAAHPDLVDFSAAGRNLHAAGTVRVSFGVTPGAPQRVGAHMHLVAQLEAEHVRFSTQAPPLRALSGTLAFDGGHLQRSVLHADWLGGRTTLHVSERGGSEPMLEIEGQGTLAAREILSTAGIAAGGSEIEGQTGWRGELSFTPATAAHAAMWHARAESSLAGISSRLAPPFGKATSAAEPLRLEAQGSPDTALAQLALGERVHGVFELGVRANGTWRASRGALHLGPGPAVLGRESVLRVSGQLARLDLPAWLAAWRKASDYPDALPLEAQITVAELVVAGQSYPSAVLLADPAPDAFALRVQAGGLAGVVRWPRVPGGSRSPQEGISSAVEVQLERLALQPAKAGVEDLGFLAALGPSVQLSAQEVTFQGRALGRLTAQLHARGEALAIEGLRLADERQALQADLQCGVSTTPCRLKFVLESHDIATTLAAYGFRPAVTATGGSLEGELEGSREMLGAPEAPWVGVRGTLRLSLHEGSLNSPEALSGEPFALLGVTELLAPGNAPVGFSELSATYQVREGNALTSDLHLDGDAEVLMSGRIGLAAEDYDLHAVVLRGEERLPAAVRRFATAPPVAAVWLAWRDLLTRGEPRERSRAEFQLTGTWDRPVIASRR